MVTWPVAVVLGSAVRTFCKASYKVHVLWGVHTHQRKKEFSGQKNWAVIANKNTYALQNFSEPLTYYCT